MGSKEEIIPLILIYRFPVLAFEPADAVLWQRWDAEQDSPWVSPGWQSLRC